MKHQQTVERQRAFTMRYTSPVSQERAQIEAEVIALNNGDTAEARRRRNARLDLGEKQKQRLARSQAPEAGTGWLIEALGGARDSIVIMLKANDISAVQAMAALTLRDYEKARRAHFGHADTIGYTEGGSSAGMEALVDGLRSGRNAKERAKDSVDPRDWQAVYFVICGNRSMRQARRLMGCDNTNAQARLKAGIQDALDAAGAYMEVAA